MRSQNPLLAFAFATTTLALTFTSPFSGSTVDLTSPLRITWVPGTSDPSTFTLSIINTASGTSDEPQTLATSIRTSSGSYTVPANTILNYGNDFELLASDSSGTSLGKSGSFSLADGVYSLQTASDGVLTIATSTTQGSAPSSTTVGGAAATTSSASGPKSSTAESSRSSSTTARTTVSSTAGPETSSTPASSTGAQSSGSSSSSTSTTAAATSSSSNSSSNSNLGFDNAANMVGGSVLISGAAFLGALVLLVY